MRQVNQDELVHLLVNGLREVSPSLLKQLADGRQKVAGDARYLAAGVIAAKLQRLEILSNAPEPPPFRRGGGRAPMIEPDRYG